MYKSLLIACALIAPVMAQDAPAPEAAPEKAPAPRAERENRGPGRGQALALRGKLMEKLVMDKYDADKDGKLDDAEKAKVKADAEKIREERAKARAERVAKGEGEARPERPQRGEGGPRPERGNRPGEPGGPGAPGMMDRDSMTVARALLMEKYDTDKDGRLSETELEQLKKDAETLKKEEAPAPAAE